MAASPSTWPGLGLGFGLGLGLGLGVGIGLGFGLKLGLGLGLGSGRGLGLLARHLGGGGVEGEVDREGEQLRGHLQLAA